MPKIKIRAGENFDFVLRRFKKACERFGVLSEIKKREYYEKPSEAKKKKTIAARKRMLKKFRK